MPPYQEVNKAEELSLFKHGKLGFKNIHRDYAKARQVMTVLWGVANKNCDIHKLYYNKNYSMGNSSFRKSMEKEHFKFLNRIWHNLVVMSPTKKFILVVTDKWIQASTSICGIENNYNIKTQENFKGHVSNITRKAICNFQLLTHPMLIDIKFKNMGLTLRLW
jgi:hypothetical protein